MLKKLLPLALASLFIATASADEAEIKKAMEAKLGAKVESVTKSGYLGLYEIYADGNILYTDEKMTAFIAGGQLIEGKTMKNVTEERMRKLTAIKFADLPLDRAIKQVRGDGKRVLATFEDPNCGYCKRLAKDLQKLDNVTIYTFLLPILSEDSLKKSKQIWCAADRSKAWNDCNRITYSWNCSTPDRKKKPANTANSVITAYATGDTKSEFSSRPAIAPTCFTAVPPASHPQA